MCFEFNLTHQSFGRNYETYNFVDKRTKRRSQQANIEAAKIVFFVEIMFANDCNFSQTFAKIEFYKGIT